MKLESCNSYNSPMNCSRVNAEEPNNESVIIQVYPSEPACARSFSVEIEDQAFSALAIARFENEGA